MKERMQEWLAMWRRQPPGAQMAVAGLVLLFAVLALSEIYRALQPEPAQSVPSSNVSAAPPIAPQTAAASAGPVIAVNPSPLTSAEEPSPAQPEVSTRSLRPPAPFPPPTLPPIADITASQPRLVIILDDIGYSAEAGQRALDLPGAVTYAILPYTPHGHWLAEEAHRRKRDVMLHAPMSNLAGMALGPGGMTLEMDEATLRKTLRDAIADIPHVRGVNNHTGSELTTHRQPMEWVMKELKALDLFFVDSLTHSASVAGNVATEYKIPTLTRHVFLDNVAEADAIARQFQQALTIARRDGLAIAIGHPYPATLAYLEEVLPTLQDEGVELVKVTQLLEVNQPASSDDNQADH